VVRDDLRVLDEATIAANERSLRRYRFMAYLTGTLLIILVFVGVPLQVAHVTSAVAKIVGTAHGFLFLVYLAAAFDVTVRLRVPVGRMLLVLLAGTIPFAAFYAERRLTEFCTRIERQSRAARARDAEPGQALGGRNPAGPGPQS
jgi:integral membrane protein